MEAVCTMGKCSGSKIQMNREIDSKYTLSTSVKPCFLQSDLRIPNALESKCLIETSFASSAEVNNSFSLVKITTVLEE